MFSDAVTIIFAAVMTLAVGLLFAGLRRSDQRRIVAARISLTTPWPVGAPEEATRPQEMAFLRYPTGRGSDREMREVGRVLSRLRIDRKHARAALMAAELVTAMLFSAAAFLVAQRLFHATGAIWGHATLALVGAAAGWFLPMLLAHGAADRRAASIARGLPEALELLVVCVDAGLGLENALLRVAEALKASEPLLADELAQTAADMRVLANFDEGLAKLAERVNLPSIHAVATILSQSLRYGTPLAEALRAAAAEMRSEALIKMEERGNRLPTLLTLPMMLLIFPTIFLIVVGPAALNAIDAFKH
jgi:tight adherence protein C